eukprot:CAMPEP_0119034542 /NCGR_PEP_ID=MMETSP1177-20130426/1521_1 /TAXON_ID=2985 /ORGANISM="Ochromonas sp, Strain CCMP1899" /LENGTH=203 /DNA_ID=CAMNT_0006992029 /DNA_START=61 /DNA_END=672 /DNA_ORIENTATION=+
MKALMLFLFAFFSLPKFDAFICILQKRYTRLFSGIDFEDTAHRIDRLHKRNNFTRREYVEKIYETEGFKYIENWDDTIFEKEPAESSEDEDRLYWNSKVALDASKFLPRKTVQSYIIPQKIESPIYLDIKKSKGGLERLNLKHFPGGKKSVFMTNVTNFAIKMETLFSFLFSLLFGRRIEDERDPDHDLKLPAEVKKEIDRYH